MSRTRGTTDSGSAATGDTATGTGTTSGSSASTSAGSATATSTSGASASASTSATGTGDTDTVGTTTTTTATTGAETDGTGTTGGDEGLYDPDNGPSHEGGTVVAVCSEPEILAAIADASAGDVITVCPGTFSFNQLISVDADGTDAARIFLRAEAPGTVTFNLSHIENFKISGKFWIFENITFFGACESPIAC